MSTALAAFCGTLTGLVLGYALYAMDAAGWLLHAFACVLGASWFTPRYSCPSCSRRVHLVRSRPDRAGIFGAKDGGGRCLSCSATSPRNAPQDAPGRTESREVGLNVLGWPGAPQSARRGAEPPAIQDRTDERTEQ